jgi:hypothetical protein
LRAFEFHMYPHYVKVLKQYRFKTIIVAVRHITFQ